MQDSIVYKMEKLVEEAKRTLLCKEGCYTKSDRRALEDMIVRAEKALTGKKVPFSRNREFLSPRENEEVEFSYERYTMVPSFFEKGRAHSHYGLKEALDWYRSRNMEMWTEEMLQSAKQEVQKKGSCYLETAVYGNDVGQYNEQCGQELKKALRKLEKAEDGTLAANIAVCTDVLEVFRHSRKLSSEVEPKTRFLLTEKKLKEPQTSVRKDTFVRQQYNKIEAIADEMNLADGEMLYRQIWGEYSYEELNRRFQVWGDSGRMVNVITPPGTKGARLSLRLTGKDNEQQGLGHIWVTGICLSSADGASIKISDDTFTGAEIGKAPTGEECLFLCNHISDEESAAVCRELLPLEENKGYTLFFKAKQDGKFKAGLHVKLDFLDTDGIVLDSFLYVFNRKSYVPIARKALQMQCEAIVYALGEEREYAQKAKYSMLVFMNDFCQGAEYWMVHNARPEGCDAYGAVQAGRIMCSVASIIQFK